VVCYEQALSALAYLPEQRATREQAIDLRLALRTALLPSRDSRHILVCLREAEALAEALADPRRLGQVSVFLSNYFYIMGAYDQAMAAAQRALADGEVVLYALANLYLGLASHTQGEYRRAVECFGQTVASLDGTRRGERFGQVSLPAVHSRARLAWCHAELGTFVEGRTLGDEGLRIAEAVAHPASILIASWGCGLLALHQGDLPRALPLLERALDLCQDTDFLAWFPLMAAALGAAYVLAGRVADAVPLLTRALEQTTSMAMVPFQALCSLALGEAQLHAAHLEEAHALAEQAIALARVHQERGNQAYALRLFGQIAAQCESPNAAVAETHYRQACALAEELDMRPLQAHCYRDLGILYAAIGQREPARTELSTAMAMYRAMDMTFWLSQTEAVLAQVKEG